MNKKPLNIKTPDQRLRVFISSTLKELADERVAVKNSVERLRLIPVMFELGARPHPPKDLYLAYLEQSDIFIGIYWQSYGWIAENESVSGIEDEYRASDKLPRLIYVKEPASLREEKLNNLLDLIRSTGRISYKSFSTPKELEKIVTDDLAIMISERFHTENIQMQKEISSVKTHSNLPLHLLPIIGRDKDIEILTDLVKNKLQHLITITGPGGIGKTRLAHTVAASFIDFFDDGVYFIDLSDIKDEKFVFTEIGTSLGIHLSDSENPLKQIAGFISNQKILLVLDNFEQLASATADISSLFRSCPNLTIIITSRNSLNMTVENEYNLSALSTPDRSDNFESIIESPSVKLFISKAASVDSKFSLTEKNCQEVATICRLLEGIPLAISLAAVKVRMFSPKMILERLSNKLSLLSGGSSDAPARHRTMKAAIEWSVELLNDDEKNLFRRLAVFSGGFDYNAVENICFEEFENSADLIESLLTKYLIKKEMEINGIPRYAMPSLFNEYSRYLFNQSDEINDLKLKHAKYYLRRAIEDADAFSSHKVFELSDYWGQDVANVIDAAYTFYSNKKYPELVNLIYSLWQLFWIFDFDSELESKINISELLNQAENLSGDEQGKLIWIAGASALSKGDNDKAENLFTDAKEFFKGTPNIRGYAWSNHLITTIHAAKHKEDSNKEILKSFEESLNMFRESGDHWGICGVIQNTAALETVLKHYSKSLKLYDEYEKLARKSSNTSQLAHILFMRGWIHINMKKYDAALQYLKEGMVYYKDGDSMEGMCYALIISAYYFFKTGNDSKAMFMAGLLENIMSKYRFTPWQMISSVTDYVNSKVNSKKNSGVSDEFEEGLNMGVFKAIRLANEMMQSE